MEATGSDGGHRPSLPWTNRRGNQIGSNPYGNSISSSSSGTIVSTMYTFSGSTSLSSISIDAVVRHFELALDEDTERSEPIKKSCKEREERTKYMDMKSLVKEFFGAPSAELSININGNIGDMSVLERWFSELGVAWVLHLTDGDDASAELHHTSADAAERWIRGLHRILQAISHTSSTVFWGLPDVCEEEDQPMPESDKQANNVLDEIHFARFIKEVMSKMLPFVDFAIRQVVVCINGMLPAPYKKLHTLLAVYKALSDAQNKISSTSVEPLTGVDGILDKVLTAKREEAGEAIWSIMETVRNRVLESDGSSSSLIEQASSDIHKATLSVMEYVSFLRSDYLMCQFLCETACFGKYVPQSRPEHPMDSMVKDLTSCLQEKLVKISESFPDQGLRFLFLLNNIEFIRQSLMYNHFWYGLQYHDEKGEGLFEKVEVCMGNYLQACWEPVLSFLFSPTPHCFGINHSPLLKFQFEFKKTYAIQKLWKVPDPKPRKRLRTAIANKIVPRYTEYIEENNITTSGVSPQDLEKMLQELFEG